MGNQAGQTQQSQHSPNKQNPEVNENNSAIKAPIQENTYYQQNKTPQQSMQQQGYYYRTPQREYIGSKIQGYPIQINESIIGSVRQPSQVQNRVIQSPIRSSFGPIIPPPPIIKPETQIVSQTNISSQTLPQNIQIPNANIIYLSQTQNSILQKYNSTKSSKKFQIENKTFQIDEIRTQLRFIIKKITSKLLLEFDSDITKMNEVIEAQRQQKLKDKNKVLFLLKQRKHYEKLCEKFQDYSHKIQTLLLQFRKKDTVQNVTVEQINKAQQLRSQIQPLISKIQADLPQKGWAILVTQANTQLYNHVIRSANQDPQIISKYSKLQLSLANQTLFKSIVKQQLRHSMTRRIGEIVEQQSKKYIEGPVNYGIEKMQNTKYPVA